MLSGNSIKIVECPRDAMQGLLNYIPVKKKADYINALIKVGFPIIDFGSFVSPKIVPQMKDTNQVIDLIRVSPNTSLLSIVLNKKGAIDAASFDKVKILGYPLSVSEIFQKKNSNKTIKESLSVIDEIYDVCLQKDKTLLIYLSMAFGNPYGEKWNNDILLNYINEVQKKGIKMISLADTIGASTTSLIKSIYQSVNISFSELDVGVHLHSIPSESYAKIEAAWDAGCKRFDVAVSGYGGCPFAQNHLIGNIATEHILNFSANKDIQHNLNLLAFESAYNQARDIFNN